MYTTKRQKRIYLMLLIPCTLLYITTVFFPIFTTFGYSLENYVLTNPQDTRFVGAGNYLTILQDPQFHTSLINSTVILIYTLVLGLVISTLIALVLNHKTKISGLLTAITIIPWALPPLVNGIMWKFIFFPGNGLANNLLLAGGLISSPVSWINNRWVFLFIVSLVIAWRTIPFCAIVILSNLQSIPEGYYEAFYLDGGSKFQAFKNITLPLIMPSMGIVLINLTTAAVNVFDEVIAMSGYQFQNQTLLVYNYTTTFNYLNFGMGSAISYITMILTGVFGYFYVRNMTVEKVY